MGSGNGAAVCTPVKLNLQFVMQVIFGQMVAWVCLVFVLTVSTMMIGQIAKHF